MQINIFPHLSESLSMKRYFRGLMPALQTKHDVKLYEPFSEKGSVGFKRKYFDYLKLASRVKSGHNIILSERFSFLLLVLKKQSSIVVCHDMVTLHQRKAWLHRRWYKILIRCLLLSKFIICISESTRKDLLQFNPFIPADKIRVVHNGLENFWFQNSDGPSKYATEIKKPFFLMVGTDAWNKNFVSVIEAIKEVKNRNFCVVKVGPVSAINQELLRERGVNDDVYRIEQVEDNDLKWLYRNSVALLFPSLHEGFGWPALEAMASGCPVIASKTSSIPEVCGEAAWYIDPAKPETISQAMEVLLVEEQRRMKMISAGKNQASKFSWDKTAEELVYALNE